MNRITRTLRDSHEDYLLAVNQLKTCIWSYHSNDEERVVQALKDGTMNGKSHSELEVNLLRSSRFWSQRYDPNMRKIIHGENIIKDNLTNWWNRFKVTASEGQPPAQGRRDPKSNKPLFTEDTKDAIRNTKLNAGNIQDPLALNEMYDESEAGCGAKHSCPTFYSKRGDSLLEVWHLSCQHYGNIGMMEEVANALMLRGTAWHNVTVRHKREIRSLPARERQNTLARYHDVP